MYFGCFDIGHGFGSGRLTKIFYWSVGAESKGEAHLRVYTCLCTFLVPVQAQSRRAQLSGTGGLHLRGNDDARRSASGPMHETRGKPAGKPVRATQLQVLRLADKNAGQNAKRMRWLIMVLVLSTTVRLSAQNTGQAAAPA